MRPVRRGGLVDQVIDALTASIRSGAWPPGHRLPAVTELAVELDVGRSTVREAVQALAHRGVLEVAQGRGTFVADPGGAAWTLRLQRSEALDVYEARRGPEIEAARLAALRRTDEDIAALELALDRMAAAARGEGDAVDADLAFHRALLAATHNELLVRMEVVLETGLAARDRLVHGAVQDDDPTPAHAAVLDAVRDRDPEAAGAAASALLAKSLLDIDKARAVNSTAHLGEQH